MTAAPKKEQTMTTEIATAQDNYFSSYAQATTRKAIVGDLLKFTRYGEWIAGQDEEEIDAGTRYIPIMDELLIGWQKWEDGKPAEQHMGKLSEGFRPAKRSELGDDDEATWERDDKGNPKDPWQLTNMLILKAEDSDRIYTYSPSSRGGLSALGELCGQFGKMIRQKPDQYPIIELQTSSYKHEKYGKTFIPVLKVVGWTTKDAALDALNASTASATNAEDEDAPF